jgi:hypothetical protein
MTDFFDSNWVKKTLKTAQEQPSEMPKLISTGKTFIND